MTDATEPAPAVRQSRRLWVIVALVALAILAVGFPVWAWQSAEAAAGVQVVPGPGPINCNDGNLPIQTGAEDDEPAVVVQLTTKSGAWCQVPISIVNNSKHTVTIRNLTFPAMHLDKESNHGAIMVTADASGVAPHRSGDSNDAVFDVDEQVEPGEASQALIRVETNPYACQSPGVWSVPDVPIVKFSVLHREHTTRGSIRLAGGVPDGGLKWSGCAE